MKKFLKYTLLGLYLFLFVLVVAVAICWIACVDVTFGEIIRGIIKAELIAFLAVCFIAFGFTCIVGIIERIKED